MQTAKAIRRATAPQSERQPVEARFFHLVWLFLLMSFIGLVGETLASFVIDGRWESRAGFVVGPFSPIYGTGAVLFTVLVNPLRSKSVSTIFLASALVGGVFEYICGWLLEYRYGIVAWSYAGQPFNFHGYTCIGMMAVWGAIGAAWTIWGLPRAVALVERIPETMRTPLTAIAFAFIIADAACTLTALDCWFLRMSGNAPTGIAQKFFAAYCNDTFMASRFETMSMWPVLAGR